MLTSSTQLLFLKLLTGLAILLLDSLSITHLTWFWALIWLHLLNKSKIVENQCPPVTCFYEIFVVMIFKFMLLCLAKFWRSLVGIYQNLVKHFKCSVIFTLNISTFLTMIGRFLQKTVVNGYLDIPCLNFGKFVWKISIAKIFGTFILTVKVSCFELGPKILS